MTDARPHSRPVQARSEGTGYVDPSGPVCVPPIAARVPSLDLPSQAETDRGQRKARARALQGQSTETDPVTHPGDLEILRAADTGRFTETDPCPHPGDLRAQADTPSAFTASKSNVCETRPAQPATNPPLTRLQASILRFVAGYTFVMVGPICQAVFFVDSPDARERARVALAELRRRRMVESTGSRYRCTASGRICAAEPIRAKK